MLRDYQADALTKLMGKRSCLYQLPTGGGKSLVIRDLAYCHQAAGHTVTVLTHRKSIFKQLEKFGLNVVMVQSRQPLIPTDVIISDETHRAMAANWYKKIQTAAPTYNYGFTATPWRMDGKGLSALYNDMLRGPTMRQLIDRGFLAPYKYIAPLIAMKKIKTRGGDYDMEEAANHFTDRKIMGNIYETWKKYNRPKAIGFACNVKHAIELVQIFQQGGVKSDYIAGARTTAENEKIIEDFREGKIEVLWSVDMISEGFDVPSCEAVILARPTQSLSLFLQQVGRCMRPAEGKIALVLDHANNVRRHGMPCADHNWTLEGETPPQRKQRITKKTVRTCAKCHAINYIQATVCICCGEPVKNPLPIVSTDAAYVMGEFNQIKGKQTIPAWVLHYQKIGYAGLLRLAAAKGYKAGWAYYQKINAFEKYGVEIR